VICGHALSPQPELSGRDRPARQLTACSRVYQTWILTLPA